jgi:hypothetical protein
VVGSNPNVTGMSKEIPVIGPTPGKTPINVPNTHPIKQNKRFCQVNATVKPKLKLFRKSTSSS